MMTVNPLASRSTVDGNSTALQSIALMPESCPYL
jgi:hypothetical protein